jgi:toxoflavin biosynthesis protein ToxD
MRQFPPAPNRPLPARRQDADNRAAMGLPEQIVDRLPADVGDHVADLMGTPPHVLAGIVEDRSASVSRRFFAGQLLALLGDPRIIPDAPIMVDIPAATVSIGLDPQSVDSMRHQRTRHELQYDWLLTECPRHQVHLPAFRIMRYPVTNYEYHRFLIDIEYSELPTSWQFGRYPHERANHPVWPVSQDDARLYASWLSHRLGRCLRLTAEAEWEYAACGGDDREYPWGNEFDPDAANTVEAGPLSTTPVGMYPAGRSPFGVDDMAGNVEEYVRDYDYAAYADGRIDDPPPSAGWLTASPAAAASPDSPIWPTAAAGTAGTRHTHCTPSDSA